MFATTREEERRAFERFIDLVHERLAADPALHVYHYAAYEITALRRLMGQYGTREAELDDLLRRGVFVDLYKVVRGGLRVSRPGYGLKELEAFLPLEREAEIKEGGASIVAFEEWMLTRDQRDPRRDRRLQPRGLRRHAAPARLAARAAAGGARRVRAVPAARAGRVEAGQAGEGRAGGAARGAARDRRRDLRARGAAARLPRPRAQAGLVGVLRPARDDARGARRGRRVDRPARADRRARAGEEVGRLRVHVPGAGAQARAGPGRDRPRDRQERGGRSSRSTARRGRCSSSAGRASRRCRCRRR